MSRGKHRILSGVGNQQRLSSRPPPPHHQKFLPALQAAHFFRDGGIQNLTLQYMYIPNTENALGQIRLRPPPQCASPWNCMLCAWIILRIAKDVFMAKFGLN